VSRITSGTIYGKSYLDESRLPARARRYSYGLRSESSHDGWYAPPTTPRRKRHEVNVGGILTPVDADDDAPVRVVSVPDYAGERHAAGVIKMGEL